MEEHLKRQIFKMSLNMFLITRILLHVTLYNTDRSSFFSDRSEELHGRTA